VKGVDDKDLYGGLIRLHVLHHASQAPIFGLWIIEELREHGYKLSPGTLYPMLHGMENKGYLESNAIREGRRVRRLYRITPLGRAALKDAKKKVQELFGELFEERARPQRRPKAMRSSKRNDKAPRRPPLLP
jgi:DNA-binding PadR family transcriptional regulator